MRKIALIALSCILVAGVLAGCRSNVNDMDTTATTAPATTTAPTTAPTTVPTTTPPTTEATRPTTPSSTAPTTGTNPGGSTTATDDSGSRGNGNMGNPRY